MYSDEQNQELTSKLILKLAERVAASTTANSRDAVARIPEVTCEQYLRKVVDTQCRVTTIFDSINRVSVRRLFVPLELEATNSDGGARAGRPKSQQQTSTPPRFSKMDDCVRAHKHVVVSGTGGSGKTTLLRHYILDVIQKGKSIPVFMHARDLKPHNFKSLSFRLLDQLFSHAYNLGLAIEQNAFTGAVSDGRVVLIIDGIDELPRVEQVLLRSELTKVADQYRKCEILVSSRPDEDLRSFVGFDVYRICPLSQETASLLIEKLPFDDSAKRDFQTKLEVRLYNLHRQIASTPLLLCVMLLTASNAPISNFAHEYYDNAFQHMWQKHDFLKDQFVRTRSCNLDADQFVNALACLSAGTWCNDLVKQEFRGLFRKADASEIINEYQPYLSLFRTPAFSVAGLIDDLVRVLCILTSEGQQYAFSHRTFQEYYTAKLIAKLPREAINDSLRNTIILQSRHSMVFAFLWDINRTRADELASAFIRDLQNAIEFNQSLTQNNILNFCKIAFRSITFSTNYSVTFDDPSDLRNAVFVLAKMYWPELGRVSQGDEPLIRPSRKLANSVSVRRTLVPAEYSGNLADIAAAWNYRDMDFERALAVCMKIPHYVEQISSVAHATNRITTDFSSKYVFSPKLDA